MKKSFFISLCLLLMTSVVVKAQQDSTSINIQTDSILQEDKQDSIPKKRLRINGFRVQVYYGGNNQKSKIQAHKMAERVKIWFEDLQVYTSFSSPHWICRVGDFQTREEAMEVLQLMRESKRFPRAIIVKSKINITEDELRREEPDTCATGVAATYNTNIGTIGRGPIQGGLDKDSTSRGQSYD